MMEFHMMEYQGDGTSYNGIAKHGILDEHQVVVVYKLME